jgi:hypothetical protein
MTNTSIQQGNSYKRSVHAPIDIDPYAGCPVHDPREYTGISPPPIEHLLKDCAIPFVGEKLVTLVIGVSNAIAIVVRSVLPNYRSRTRSRWPLELK